MKEDVMVIPLRVPRELGRSWKMEAVKQDKSVQKWILEQVGDNRRERSSVASALVKRQANPAALDETTKGRTPGDTVQRTGAAIKGGSTPSTPATPVSVVPEGAVGSKLPALLTDTLTAKCRKCFERFPIADMVTEPKTGKLFCPDCVENMKNNQ